MKTSFSFSIPGRWRIPNYLEDGFIVNLKNSIKLRSQKDFELHVDEVRKRCDKIKSKVQRNFLIRFRQF